MRTRFFFVIFVVLVIVTAMTVSLHKLFLKNERLAQIDQQVREAAFALLDSDLNEPRKLEVAKIEKLIAAELGENRLGKFFVVRNSAGEILFESSSAKIESIPKIPQEPQWITLQERGRFFRVLNLELPKIDDRTLQVGLVVDDRLVDPSYLSKNSLTFFAVVIGVGLAVAWFLASFLAKPISRLSDFIEQTANDPEVGRRLPELPREIKHIRETPGGKRDELARLIDSFERLIVRVNRGYDLSRFWSYQMAHELKTPMAVVEAQVNQGVENQKIAPDVSKQILEEVFDVSDTISSFLSWAEVESSPGPRRQHVMKASRVLSAIVTRLSQVHGDRLVASIENEFPIMGNPQQLEQLLTNLIQNACAYSSPDQPVEVVVKDRAISIVDRGPGIPRAVLDKLGEPFNRGDQADNASRGTGLGLAYAQSVCWLHGWKMSIRSETDGAASGTTIRVEFPRLQSETDDMEAAL